MYAIIDNGNKQYKVAEGDVVRVEKLAAAEGETVSFKARSNGNSPNRISHGSITNKSKELADRAITRAIKLSRVYITFKIRL